MYQNIEYTLNSLFSWSSTPRIPILITIYNKPGISFLDIKRQCKPLKYKKLRYHLDILVSKGYVNTTLTGYNVTSWVSEFLQTCHQIAFTYKIHDRDFLYQINSIKNQHCLQLWGYLFQNKTVHTPTMNELITSLKIKPTALRRYVVRSIQSQFIMHSEASKKSLRQFYLTQKGVDTLLALKKYTTSM